jgi:sulfite exporter TauE/SafE
MPEILFLGFLLGLSHSTDSDHMSAVATFLLNNNKLILALKTGFIWGLGHSLTLLFVGFVALKFNKMIPQDIAEYLEIAVGVMLVLLGLNIIKNIIYKPVHIHTHKHDNQKHSHFHFHQYKSSHVEDKHKHNHSQSFFKILFIGIMHGMAGSAVLLALVVSSIQNVSYGLLYIIIFGAGSIVGMIISSAIIFVVMNFFAHKFNITHKYIQIAIAIVTILVGFYVIFIK